MLTRLIDGREIVLSDEEETIVRAEWLESATATIKKLAAAELEVKRLAALAALQAETLSMVLMDPNAPQEVKNYAAALTEIK